MAEFIQGQPGPKGEKGDPGPQGPEGPQGISGDIRDFDRIQNDQNSPSVAVIAGDSAITFKQNGIDYDLDLSNTANDTILGRTGPNTLALKQFTKVAFREYDPSTGFEMEKSFISLDDAGINIMVGNDFYNLRLAGGEDGAPLVKHGYDIEFGKVQANLVISDAIPLVSNAQENTIYFAYDPHEVISAGHGTAIYTSHTNMSYLSQVG